ERHAVAVTLHEGLGLIVEITAGADAVGANAVAAEITGEIAREIDHAGFDEIIARRLNHFRPSIEARIVGNDSVDAGDIDDGTAALLLHGGDCSLTMAKETGEVALGGGA